ncbi:YceI family protein [Daejeonella lutea]|uniref:Polyisoprenoid-binding protein YceI n=1 Tax=Daejeonella lutea TaxID=572036 RepID=A0A1T5EQD6_9SPHI|nr:YceI family protein [Daejeonella lutea]SKB86078.1 Polyisoprenoid-binding protein YceI [Daejeonella lutea]
MSVKTKWSLDPTHSEVHFKVKHLVISTVTGTFKTFDGSFATENEDFTNAEINFSLDVNSIDTNQEQRDNHLKSGDFFDAEKYPKITFKSTAFTKDGDDYVLQGDLSIKDVTKPVKLNVEYGGTATDFYGNEKAGFEITGKISRKEFGLTWDAVTEAGAIVVGDEIKMNINVQFAKQAEQ